MQLIFIRHTSLNIERGICYGQSDVEVSATFATEAALVKAQLDSYAIDAVYSSPLSRCTLLANFCGFQQPITDSLLLELNFGRWELQPWNSIAHADIEPWYADWLNHPTPNGESFAQQIVRVRQFIEQLAQTPHQTIAIFTHGGVIRAAATYFHAVTPTNAFSFKVDYGSLTHFYTAEAI